MLLVEKVRMYEHNIREFNVSNRMHVSYFKACYKL